MTDLPKIVIVGAGTGGTIVANKLAKKLGKKKIDLTVIDPTFNHVYQPGFLFTMFGREEPENLVKDSRDLMPKWINSVQDKVSLIDTSNKSVKTESSGDYEYDYIVIASGARIATDAVEWWDDSIHHFYSNPASVKLKDALENFTEGKIVVSIADLPYKCPPAPIEACMLMDDYYRKKGLRDKVDIVYTSPLNRAFAIETTNIRVEEYLKEKDIEYLTLFNADYVDSEEKWIESLEGEDIDYDLLVMVPPHRGHQFVLDSEIAGGKGWIPTDKYTLKVEGQENMWALGDCTDIPTSKAGSTAHYQAPVIAKNIASLIKGETPKAKYDGHVQCFFLTEFGSSMFIDFNYESPPKPSPTRKIWWWFKLLFKPLYFLGVARARV
jgi:sulfide:quinone oxidoreductase